MEVGSKWMSQASSIKLDNNNDVKIKQEVNLSLAKRDKQKGSNTGHAKERPSASEEVVARPRNILPRPRNIFACPRTFLARPSPIQVNPSLVLKYGRCRINLYGILP